MMRPVDRGPQRGLWSTGALAMLAPLALAACNTGGSDDEPGGVSEGEASALDDAAEMLDRQQLPEGAVPPVDVPVAQQAPKAGQSGPAKADRPAQDPE